MIEIITKKATDSIKKELNQYTTANVNKALSKAINHTIGVLNTEMNRRIRDQYNIPVQVLNRNKYQIKSSSSNLTAYIYASKSPLPLSLFNPIETSGGVQTRRVGGGGGAFASRKVKSKKTGVQVMVIKGKSKTIFDAFISISSRQGTGAVIGQGRYNGKNFQFDSRGIRESRLNSKSVFVTANERQVKRALSSKVSSVLPSRIMHELSRLKT